MLGHVALRVDLDDQVKVALGILGGGGCVGANDVLAAAILLLRAYGSPMQPSASMQCRHPLMPNQASLLGSGVPLDSPLEGHSL